MDTPQTPNGTQTLPVGPPSSLPLDDYTAELNALLRMTAAFRSVLGQLENFALCLAAKSTRPGPPTSPSGALNSRDPSLRSALDLEHEVSAMEILKQVEENRKQLVGRTVRCSRRIPETVKQGEEDHELSAAADK